LTGRPGIRALRHQLPSAAPGWEICAGSKYSNRLPGAAETPAGAVTKAVAAGAYCVRECVNQPVGYARTSEEYKTV